MFRYPPTSLLPCGLRLSAATAVYILWHSSQIATQISFYFLVLYLSEMIHFILSLYQCCCPLSTIVQPMYPPQSLRVSHYYRDCRHIVQLRTCFFSNFIPKPFVSRSTNIHNFCHIIIYVIKKMIKEITPQIIKTVSRSNMQYGVFISKCVFDFWPIPLIIIALRYYSTQMLSLLLILTCLDATISVSYTHLDVYKRQTINRVI